VSAALQPTSVDDFLAWEARQPTRHEFDGIRVVAMTGGTAEHAAIGANLAFAMIGALRGSPYRFFNSDLKVEVGHGAIRYPDGFVTCTAVPRGTTVVRDPVVIFEVLSESTAEVDRTVKMEEYRAAPSVQRYVMLEQNHVLATMFTREGERWVGSLVRAGEAIAMPEIGVTLSLDDLYVGVELPPPLPKFDAAPADR
jgi:Uma2 family endonuclease